MCFVHIENTDIFPPIEKSTIFELQMRLATQNLLLCNQPACQLGLHANSNLLAICTEFLSQCASCTSKTLTFSRLLRNRRFSSFKCAWRPRIFSYATSRPASLVCMLIATSWPFALS